MSRYSEEEWKNEIVGQAKNINKKGNLSEIVGMRAPFLATGGDAMLSMLYKNGFLYDSSIPSSETQPPLWPYTFDSAMPHRCYVSKCPKGYFPGVWEVPMTDYATKVYDGGRIGIGCSMYDACLHPEDVDKIADIFYANFLLHYQSNRAPLLLSAHTAWYFVDRQRETALIKFIERVLKLGDVWFVSVKQALQWMQSPTPVDQLGSFKPWRCDK